MPSARWAATAFASTGSTAATAKRAYTDSAHPYYASDSWDWQGNWQGYAYDTPGNLLTLTNSLTAPGNVTRASYNGDGTVATNTDALGHVTTYTYTYSGGKLTKVVVAPPAPLGTITVTFDGIGRKTSVTDGKGQTTSDTYDVLNRVTRVTFGGDTGCASHATCTDTTYDTNGNVLSVVDTNGITTFTYDKQNHVLTKVLSWNAGASVTYSYDAVGNLLMVQDAGGTVTYSYDPADNLTALFEPGQSGATPHTTFAYDSNNRRLHTTYPNGVTLTTVFDTSGRLVSITGDRGATHLTGFRYTYANGTGGDIALRSTMTNTVTNVTTTYSYDVLNRLTEANAPGVDSTYGYDAVGNRTSAALNGTSAWATATYNAANELTSLGSQTFGYDANGNETGRSTGITAFGYNAKDQSTSMTAGGTVTPITGIVVGGTTIPMTYTGDSQVQRINIGGTGGANFVYTALGLSEQTGSGTASYIRTNGGRLVSERIGGSSYYYLFDGLGSVVALTDGSGTVVDTYSYDPYGKVTPGAGNSVTNPWQYTGGYLDGQTGLVKLGHRYYDPGIGRWTQLDPLGGGYVYASDNPISIIDPTGLEDSVNIGDGEPYPGGGDGGDDPPQPADPTPDVGDPMQPKDPPVPGWVWGGSDPPTAGKGSWYDPDGNGRLYPDPNGHPKPRFG